MSLFFFTQAGLGRFLLPVLLGFGLDLLLGDPRGFPHPVVYMGRIITFSESRLRARFSQSPAGQLCAGRILAVFLPLCTLIFSWAALLAASHLGNIFALALESFWCWQALALRDLKKESMEVFTALEKQGLPAARKAVSRIVGRDTQALNEVGVCRATVETVAENLSDGVIAPLFYMALGGAPLALCYKAINTMDSMIGYKNERYLYFGRAAAHLDDWANFLPSRIAAFLLMGAAFFCGLDGRKAFFIWKRDRFCHSSPNSAQTESACAGAMGLQLGGDSFYFGKLTKKPTIGAPLRPICRKDISVACRLLYVSAFEALFLFSLLRCGLYFLLSML